MTPGMQTQIDRSDADPVEAGAGPMPLLPMDADCVAELCLRGDESVLVDGDPTFADALRDALPLGRCVRASALWPERVTGSFDVACGRFLGKDRGDLVPRVTRLARETRPGGHVTLIDEDRTALSLWPEVPGFDAVWRARLFQLERERRHPSVGRALTGLLAQAGMRPMRALSISAGGCAGEEQFDDLTQQLVQELVDAGDGLIEQRLVTERALTDTLTALFDWRRRPDASVWHTVHLAEGVRGNDSCIAVTP